MTSIFQAVSKQKLASMPRIHITFRSLALPLLLAGSALALVACGGGSTDTSPKANINSVKVFGDSLADSGVFGFKFTVQGATPSTPYLIWPERIASTYGVTALCPRYMATSPDGSTVGLNSAATACTNYAVGGGRINYPSAPTSGFAIGEQLVRGAAESGSYKPTDLLLIDGGGNDAADLAGAFLTASTSPNYVTLLGSLGVTPTAATQAGLAQAGGAYMTKLADTFYTMIKTNALDKGASRVVVLNAPGITNTPRFKALLGFIALQSGGGATGAAAAAQIDGMIQSWTVAFNTQLAAKFAGDSRVAVVDFYTDFNTQIASPAQFSLTNVVNTACPAVGTGNDGLPVYNFPACTSTALNASTPTWQSYAFSDGFHPTPYGHQLLAQLVSRSLSKAGWL